MSGFFAWVHAGGRSADPAGVRRAALLAVGAAGVVRDTPRGLWAQGPRLECPDAPAGVVGSGEVILVGSARFDDRAGLRRELGRQHPLGTLAGEGDDLTLALRAYETWGEGFARWLAGDYALVVDDAARERTVCARDAFGVRPLYYARLGDGLVCASTLSAVRHHPLVAAALDEDWLRAFVRHGCSPDWTASIWRDVRAVLPAHTMTFTRGHWAHREHWTLPEVAPVRRADARDAVDGFRAVLATAVRERLPHEALGIRLSGGLDSTSIAALAREAAPTLPIHAVTAGYRSLIPDDEWDFAHGVAERLGMTHEPLWDDAPAELTLLGEAAARFPRPVDPGHASSLAVNARLASHARVAFYGEDGDALLHPPGLLGTLLTMPPGELAPSAGDWLSYWRHEGRRPWLGVDWRRRLLRLRHARAFDHGPFSWMRPGTPGRAAHFPERNAGRPRWPLLRGPAWPDLHELADPQFTGIPVETRWPLLDQRLLAFVATLPSVPYLQQKWILRQAVDGALPDVVVRRPKTTVSGYDAARAAQFRAAGFPRRRWSEVTRTFVDVDALEREFQHGMPQSVVASLRVIALDDWCGRNA